MMAIMDLFNRTPTPTIAQRESPFSGYPYYDYCLTLPGTNTSYYYYDPLNYPTPPPVLLIHRTLKEWYKDLPIPPLLTTQHPIVIPKSTPRQPNRWNCGLHMLLINLATIYQGGPPTLRHTQRHAEQLSRIQLRYTLTG